MPAVTGLGLERIPLAPTGELDQEFIDTEFAAIVSANWPIDTAPAVRTGCARLDPRQPRAGRTRTVQPAPPDPWLAAHEARPRPRSPPNRSNGPTQ